MAMKRRPLVFLEKKEQFISRKIDLALLWPILLVAFP